MKQANRYNNTALIDADYILWIACNPNKVLGPDGQPTKKDNKFVYTDKTVEQAINTCDAYMTDILNLTKSDSYILFLTTGTTFRFSLDNSYKANRVGLEKPMWFHEVKAHMVEQWGAIEVPGLEADDMVVIVKNALDNCFIVAADKDILDCVPGTHFDARKTKGLFVETTFKDAQFNFARSLLTGDSIDGIPNLVKGMGPKTAEDELKKRMEFNNPITSAFLTFVYHLGEHEGITRFAKQYQLLKIIDSFEHVPAGIKFEMPDPNCWNCTETMLSADDYQIKYNNANEISEESES